MHLFRPIWNLLINIEFEARDRDIEIYNLVDPLGFYTEQTHCMTVEWIQSVLKTHLFFFLKRNEKKKKEVEKRPCEWIAHNFRFAFRFPIYSACVYVGGCASISCSGQIVNASMSSNGKQSLCELITSTTFNVIISWFESFESCKYHIKVNRFTNKIKG